MTMDRRHFLRIAGVAGCGVVAGRGTARASQAPAKDGEFYGMLIDTTLCVGCRSCEEACNAKNGLPKPSVPFDEPSALDQKREPTADAFTVLNKFDNPKDKENPIFVRKQCMHCNQPACASACLVKALEKTKDGPVVYNKDRCMGCRYCMIACPFDIPKYQYDTPDPYLRKCVMCFDKVAKGEQPACAEACPTGATQFGKRRELLEIARKRIADEPDKYVHHIYGEHEAGGTAVMYLSSVPFDKLGMRTDLGSKPYPEHTSGFLYGVPLVFVLWPSLLVGLSYLTRDKAHPENQGEK